MYVHFGVGTKRMKTLFPISLGPSQEIGIDPRISRLLSRSANDVFITHDQYTSRTLAAHL